MTDRHFDVVVLGRSLGCLATAALLARRDFRVMVLGQGQQQSTYQFHEHKVPRRSFCLLFSETPVWRRIAQDLAQSQAFRRRTRRNEPSYGVMSSRHRLHVTPDRISFGMELARTFPDVRPFVEELVFRLGQASRHLGLEFETDRMWPPNGAVSQVWNRHFGTKHSLGNVAAAELLEKFPAEHLYRSGALLPAQFAGNWAGAREALPALSVARLSSQWLNHSVTFEGGDGGLEAFFVERIQAHGGICDLRDNATRIAVRRGKVTGVELNEGENSVGADCLVTDLPRDQILELAEVESAGREAKDAPGLRPAVGRFVVSCLVRREALPEPLAQTSFFLPERGAPALQVQRFPNTGDPHTCWLVAETLSKLSEKRGLRQLRERILQALCAQLPFLREHLLLCDSPHDGLPLQVFEAGKPRSMERLVLEGASRGPEAMELQWEAERPGHLGLAGEPVQGPLSSAFQVGKTVFPGLGQEGELLAAWMAAKWITKSDRTWQERKRQMWTKIDTDLS